MLLCTFFKCLFELISFIYSNLHFWCNRQNLFSLQMPRTQKIFRNQKFWGKSVPAKRSRVIQSISDCQENDAVEYNVCNSSKAQAGPFIHIRQLRHSLRAAGGKSRFKSNIKIRVWIFHYMDIS